MDYLDTAKQNLDMLLEKQEALLDEIKDNYDLDEEDCLDAIACGDIELEWDEQRDVGYADDAVRCQEMLVRALELLNAGDKKSVHNANKAFETLVHQARKVKKDREEDIKKAQELVCLMNEIIRVCDEHRQ